MDKHSCKKNGGRNSGKTYSYSDRKALIDLASNFSNYMKENYSNVKFVKDIKPKHIQEFLNSKKDNCSNETLKQYGSKFRKLEKIVNSTYNIKVNYKDFVVPITKEQTKIRNSSMSKEDFKKLENYFKTSNSHGGIAIQITAKVGLRVAELSKLQGRDININTMEVHVEGGKGGRNRDVKIRAEDKFFFVNLKNSVADMERICPVKSSSINKSIRRAMQKTGIDKKYVDTSVHCIRKMYAQEQFDRYRESGLDIKKSLGATSVDLGHGKDRIELMSSYVLNIH